MSEASSQSTPRLTRPEAVIFQYIVEGKASQEVADLLFLRKHTVEFHLANIYEKLNVLNRTQAIHQGLRLGLLKT